MRPLIIFMTHYSKRHGRSDGAPRRGNTALFVSAVYFPILRHPGGRFLANINSFLALHRLLLRHFALALNDTRLGLVIGLGLIAFGSGGIKPCVSANVGDQFGESNKHLLSKVFGWFYFRLPDHFHHARSSSRSALARSGWPSGIAMVIATIFGSGKKICPYPPAGLGFSTDVQPKGSGSAGSAIIYVFCGLLVLWDRQRRPWTLSAAHGSEWLGMALHPRCRRPTVLILFSFRS
jgi:POT family proton-dependent oligopeptide transporter